MYKILFLHFKDLFRFFCLQIFFLETSLKLDLVEDEIVLQAEDLLICQSPVYKL